MRNEVRPCSLVLLAVVIAAAVLTLPGCVTHDYTGERYAPTDHVRVFYDGSTPSGYRVIGRDRAEAAEYMSTEQIVQEMVVKAQEVGADAISVTGVETVQVGSTTNTYGRDSRDTEYYATKDGELHTRHSSSGNWRENSYTTVQNDKVVTAIFLKQE